MDEVSGDIGGEPPAKKSKKSRNRHAYKKTGGKRAIYKFDIGNIGENGLPPVRMSKRHSFDDDLVEATMEGGFGTRVAQLIGTDEATIDARRSFWKTERGELFELVDEKHRRKVKDLHHFYDGDVRSEIAGPEVLKSQFEMSLGTFSNLPYENLWTSKMLHRCLEDGYTGYGLEGARALVARFREVMGLPPVAWPRPTISVHICIEDDGDAEEMDVKLCTTLPIWGGVREHLGPPKCHLQSISYGGDDIGEVDGPTPVDLGMEDGCRLTVRTKAIHE
jgi:hypothetical protein